MKKFIFSICFILLIFSCSKKEEIANANNKIEVIDYSERLVTLDKPAEKIIVMADNAFMIVKQLDAIDKVVALDSKTKGYWDLYLVSNTNPELQTLPDVGKTKNPNYEEIISLDADLILFKGNKDVCDTMQRKTGIPVVSIISKAGYDFEIYNLIGKVLGKEKEASIVIDELKSQKEKLETLLSEIPENEKKSAYIVVQNSNKNLFKTQKTASSLELASVLNVASDASNVNEWGFAEISEEEFLNWNPNLIFLDQPIGENAITKELLYSNSSYKFCNAVQNKQIYHTYSFSVPKDYVIVIAEAYYYANIAYPNLLSEEVYEKVINSIFEKTYNLENYYEEWTKEHN